MPVQSLHIRRFKVETHPPHTVRFSRAQHGSGFLARDRAVSYVTAEIRAVPVDLVDGRVGILRGGGNGVAQTDDAQHAATGRRDLVAG